MENGDAKQPATELLEVEDEEQRHERIQELFSRLNSAPVLTSPSAAPASRTPFDFGDRTTFVPAPPSELLARVQAFLPELAAANVDLLRRAREDPGSVDIESLEPSQHGYIEMNLGLGVFEQRGTRDAPPGVPVADVDLDAAVANADADADSSDSDGDGGDDSSDASSDISSDSADSSNSDAFSSTSSPRAVRPLPRRARGPGIVELPDAVS